MNPDVKAAWISALEGDEYEQGRSRLLTEDGKRCCLGVLCELAVKAGVIPEPSHKYGEWEYDGADLVLPEAVSKWAGLSSVSPYDDDDGHINEDPAVNPIVPNPDFDKHEDDFAVMPSLKYVSLAELNDADASTAGETFTHRYDFKAIAGIIKENL